MDTAGSTLTGSELSVVIPTTGSAEYLRSTIDSVLGEAPDAEILVIDDGVQKRPTLPPVAKWVANPGKGLASARDCGAHLASRPFLTFVDHDDVVVAGGISTRLSFLARHENLAAVVGRIDSIIDQNGIELGTPASFFPEAWSLPCGTLRGLKNSGPFLMPLWLFLFRTNTVLEAASWDPAYSLWTDRDWLAKYSRKLLIGSLKCPVAKYRIHASNHSGRPKGKHFLASRRVRAEALLALYNERRSLCPLAFPS